MNPGFTEVVISYIDEALDIDDLENIGDEIRSLMNIHGVADWQQADALRTLHAYLSGILHSESDHLRSARLKAAISHIEADYTDYIITRETETLPE